MRPSAPTRSYAFVRYFPDKAGDPGNPACLVAYRWLSTLTVPRMVCEALGLWKAIGETGETTSAHISEAEIATVLHGDALVSHDPVPRAGLVLAVLARRARKSVPDAPQCALNWTTFGTEAGQPRLGDIVCSLSEGGPRVGLYVGEDDLAYHCLGVTEDDRMGVERVPKKWLYAVRRPLYEGVQYAPNGIRLNRDGTLYA